MPPTTESAGDPIERILRMAEGAMALASWPAAANTETDLSPARIEAYAKGCSLAATTLSAALTLAGAGTPQQNEVLRELSAVVALMGDRLLEEPQATPAVEAT